MLAVGEHLGRSEMVLVELANTEPENGSGAKQVNIASEQRRAEDLLEENRLYRQTAMEQGDTALASVLDELERVLLDVAHSPQQLSAAQLETIRDRIAAEGILFKVRVVGRELQQRGASAQPGESRAAKSRSVADQFCRASSITKRRITSEASATMSSTRVRASG